jgi:hypothetical protein
MLATIGIGNAARSQDLMITGVMDGTLALAGGGSPKVIELYAINAVPSLNKYALSRASNGASIYDVISADFILPDVPLAAGSFYYAVGNSFNDMTVAFDAVYPALTGSRVRNFGVNSNGDDVTGLFFDATGAFPADLSTVTQIDVVGALGIDGTGTAWDHVDGWLYSLNTRTPSTTFNVADWTVSGIDVLDGLDEAGIAASFPEGTFGSGPLLDADFDGDLDVDGNDFLIWQRGLGTGTANADGNTDGDTDVDATDLANWKAAFGLPVPPVVAAAAAVPEPACASLLAIGLGVLARRRRR